VDIKVCEFGDLKTKMRILKGGFEDELNEITGISHATSYEWVLLTYFQDNEQYPPTYTHNPPPYIHSCNS